MSICKLYLEMNTKRSKQPKCATKASKSSHIISNGDAEVFVLPPNLLEKLGIQIGNLQSTWECPTSINKTDLGASHNKHWNKEHIDETTNVSFNVTKKSPIRRESSILETANLMKESVFLSPTFVPTVANVIAGEVEIANTPKQSGKTNIHNNHEFLPPFGTQPILHSDYKIETANFTEISSQHNASQKLDELEYQEKNINNNGIQLENHEYTKSHHQDVRENPTESSKTTIVLPSLKCSDLSDIKKDDTSLSIISERNQLSEKQKNQENIYNSKEAIQKENCDIQTLHHSPKAVTNKMEKSQASALKHNDKIAKDVENISTGDLSNLKNKSVNKETNKIKILSQEVVNFNLGSDCNFIHSSNKNCLIPVTVDTIISTKKGKSYPKKTDFITEQKGFLTTNREVKNDEYIVTTNGNYHDTLDCNENAQENSELVDELLIQLILDKHSDTSNGIVIETEEICHDKIAMSDKNPLNDGGVCPTVKKVKEKKSLINNNTISKIDLDLEINNVHKAGLHEINNFVVLSDDHSNLCNFSVTEPLIADSNYNFSNHNALKHVSDKTDPEKFLNTLEKSNENQEAICKLKKKKKFLPVLSTNKNKKDKASQAIYGATKLKTCVGLENSGGKDLEELVFSNLNLKTYSRQKTHTSKVFHFSKESKALSEDIKHDIDTIPSVVSPSTSGIQKYCLCDDFGYLTNHDLDNLYEHIHFWQSETINCDPEIILSIYDDNDTVLVDRVSQDVLTDNEEVIENESYGICWNGIYSQRYKSMSYLNSSEFTKTENDLMQALPSVSNAFKVKEENNYEKKNAEVTAKLLEIQPLITLDNKLSPVNSSITIDGLSALEMSVDNNIAANNLILNETIDTTATSPLQSFPKITIGKDMISENKNIPIGDTQLKIDIDEETWAGTNITDANDSSQSICKLEELENRELYQVRSSSSENCETIDLNTKNKNQNNNETKEIVKISNIKLEIIGQNQTAITSVNLTYEIPKEDLIEEIAISHTMEKRRRLNTNEAANLSKVEGSPSINYVTCGVCKKALKEEDWKAHAIQEHDFVAWKVGQTNIDFKDENFVQELCEILKEKKVLECSNCRFKINHIETFILHIENCVKPLTPVEVAPPDSNNSEQIVCGVCKSTVAVADWIPHIRDNHNYLAWKNGDTPIDQDDEYQVRQYLQSISYQCNGLVCAKCGFTRKYVKYFLSHIKKCGSSIGQINAVTDNSVNSSLISADGTFDKSVANLTELEGVDGPIVENTDNYFIVNETVETHTQEIPIDLDQPNPSDAIVCGVCQNNVAFTQWIPHIRDEHNYLAWKYGETPIDPDNKDQVWKHLHAISIKYDGLTCGKCGNCRKYPKNYLSHIKICDGEIGQISGVTENSGNSSLTSADVTFDKNVANLTELEGVDGLAVENTDNSSVVNETVETHMQKPDICVCGVCKNTVEVSQWIPHIRDEHSYLAWKDEETPVDQDNEDQVWQHLHAISIEYNGLSCAKCRLTRKYPKSYLSHINKCDGNINQNLSLMDTLIYNATLDTSQVNNDDEGTSDKEDVRPGRRKRARISSSSSDESLMAKRNKRLFLEDKIVTCGVCKQDYKETQWINHIEMEHNYLAWKIGEPPLNLDDKKSVCHHLKTLSKTHGGLVCSKCKCIRKTARMYLEHIETCDLVSTSDNNDEQAYVLVPHGKDVKCAVCEQEVQSSLWLKHIQGQHDYLAWEDGQIPLKIDDEEIVRQYLNAIIKKYGQLECSKCIYKSKYVKSYLKHIQSCEGQKGIMVKCAVCKIDILKKLWIEHIKNNHKYLAWKETEPELKLDDQEEVWEHLHSLSKKLGGLTCCYCGSVRKYVKSYLVHMQTCTATSTSNLASEEPEDLPPIVRCGVCKFKVHGKRWIRHTEKNHNYLAWIDGRTPLDLEDDECVREHLNGIARSVDGLLCIKCKSRWKYAKVYLEHIRTCTGPEIQPVQTAEVDILDFSDLDAEVKCGVCSKNVVARYWIKHIQIAHNYLAWIEGQTPLQLDNDEVVWQHLNNIIKHVEYLSCAKCGFSRRTPKAYQSHFPCDAAMPSNVRDDTSENHGYYECAMCHKHILPADWNKHAMNEHYNVTWIEGDVPIDIKSPYGAEKHLRKYQKKKGKLVCKNCGLTRVSLMGFFVHVITCGKTDEEIAMFKEDCTICDSKYWSMYRSQHMNWHREQEYAKERKLAKLEKKYQQEEEGPPPSPCPIGRRKAALKANTVIENYSKGKTTYEYTYMCSGCGFGTELKNQFHAHKCDHVVEPKSDESGESEDNEETDYDENNPSDDEQNVDRRVRRREAPPKPSWIPFKLLQTKPYYDDTIKCFRSENFTDAILFPNWHSSQYEFLTEDQFADYMPIVENSCKVNLNGVWSTYNKFEGSYANRVYSMFAGGSIQEVSWAPARAHGCGHYLAVAAHCGSDAPRHPYDRTLVHPALIQIWDAGPFDKSTAPKLVLGIAHEFGTVWSLDWCPSGARDAFDLDSGERKWSRLGLLAVACSDGAAYILSVPHPASIIEDSEKLFIKLKPVAELRFGIKSESSRRYQATAISWSKKKDHAVIIVGYSNGSIARYDLLNESPMLKFTENDMDVFYPYHDERTLNACLSDLDSFPMPGGALDAVCAASPTGAALVGAGRVPSRLPAVRAAFTPAWPSAMLAGDDGIVNQSPNELEWHGCGRRLGAIRTGAGCGRCGRSLVHTPPLLRTTRLFPPCIELHKRIVASINMVSVLKKKKKDKQKLDELSVKIEPITYDTAIQKYGIEFNVLARNFRPNVTPREPFPERFPLADVTSLAYCTCAQHHDIAAIATHAGLVFMITAL